jgi:hypothetical protein
MNYCKFVIALEQLILEKLDLLADCRNQRLIPNPEHPDHPVAMIKRVVQD